MDVMLKTDCKSLVDAVHSLSNVTKNKSSTREVFAFREALQRGEVRSMSHNPGTRHLPDALTKDSVAGRKRAWESARGMVEGSWRQGAWTRRWLGEEDVEEWEVDNELRY